MKRAAAARRERSLSARGWATDRARWRKLRSGPRCVNITVGLPIVRTSVAHGTAYDIAGKGVADESSLVSAVRVAARLAARNNRPSESSLS